MKKPKSRQVRKAVQTEAPPKPAKQPGRPPHEVVGNMFSVVIAPVKHGQAAATLSVSKDMRVGELWTRLCNIVGPDRAVSLRPHFHLQ